MTSLNRRGRKGAALAATAAALIIAISSNPSWALLWPFGANSQERQEPPRIDKTFGDWNLTALHEGIDMPNHQGTPVMAVESGFVLTTPRLDGTNLESILIGNTTNSVEGWRYGHVHSNLQKGDRVVAGNEIGRVINFQQDNNNSNDHLHLERANVGETVIPVNPFRLYRDAAARMPVQEPILPEEKVFFVRDKEVALGTFTRLGNGITILHGAVDIVAEPHVRVNDSLRPGAYSLSYEVAEVPDDAQPIPKRILARFDELSLEALIEKFTPMYTLRSTHTAATASSSLYQGRYVLTNVGGTDLSRVDPQNGASNASENAWFTKLKKGLDDSGGPARPEDMARHPEEAKYRDGEYTVIVRAGTFDDAAIVSVPRRVIVHNFRVIPLRIIIKTLRGATRLLLLWTWDEAQKKIKLSIPENIPLGSGTHIIEIEFSEPVINPSLSIDTVGVLKLSPLYPRRNQRKFTAVLDTDSSPSIQDGLRTMTITAQDLGRDELLALSPADTEIDPATQMARGANDVLLGTGGAALARFSINRPPPLALISGGQEPMDGGKGTSTIVAQSLSGAGIFSASDSGGLNSVVLARPPGENLEIVEPVGLDPADLPAGTTFIRGRFTGLALGTHTLSVFDRSGQETRARWSVDSLTMNTSTISTSIFDPATGRFAGRLGLDFSGTRDLLRLELVKAPLEDPINLSLTNSLPLAGKSDTKTFELNSSPFFADPLSTVELIPPGGLPDPRTVLQPAWQFFLRDKDGGVLDAGLTAAQGAWAGALPGKIYPWVPALSTGTQESPLYDLFEGDGKALPGAVIPVGNVRDLVTGLTFRHDPVSVNLRETGLLSGLPIGRQVIGRVSLTLRTGPEPETLGPAKTLIDAEIDAELKAVLVPIVLPNEYVPVQRYFKLGLSFTRSVPAAINSINCQPSSTQNGEICASGKNFEPEITSAGDSLFGQLVVTGGTPASGVPVAAGQNQSIPLGFGLSASGVNVGKSGPFLPSQTAGSAARGFKGLPRDAALFLRSHPLAALITAPFQASVTYDALGLTPGQEELARAVKVSTSGLNTRLESTAEPGGDKLTFTLDPPARALDLSQVPERLELEVPDYPDPAIVELPGLELVSNRAGAAATAGSASPEAIAALKAQGLHLASPAFTLTASTTLNPPGILKLDYNPEASLALGFPLEDLFIARIDPSGTTLALAAPVTDSVNSWVTAEITEAQGLYAVLASSPVAPPEPPPPPPPTPDTVPPVTTVQVGVSSFTDSGGTLFVSTSALVSFSAEDPTPGSGLARIETALDGGAFTAFTAAFSLAAGTHTIQYRAADLAGNLEAARSLALTSDGQAPNTALLVNGIAAAGGELFLSATDQLGLASTDTVSGVSAIRYSLDDEPLSDFATAFALAPGTHTVTFWAMDLVGNQEASRAVAVTIRSAPRFDLAPFLAGGRVLGACSGIDIKGTARLDGNLAANGLVSLAGNAVLDGNVSAGTLRSVGKSSVTGTVSTGTIDCSPVDLSALLEAIQPSALPAPAGFNRDGALVIDGRRTLSLSSGTYLVAGLTVTGGAALEVSGKVNLFVRGPISVDGRAIVNRGPTTDLAVFSDSVLPVRLSGGAFLRAILYAPNAGLIVSGGAVARGHFQAREAEITGSALAVANPDGTVHNPRDLRVLGRSSTTLELEWNPNGSPEGTAFSVEWTVGDYSCAQIPADTHGFAVVTTASRTVITGLLPSTTHLIHVHAELSGGGVTEGHTNYVTAATRGPGEGFTTPAPFDICGENFDPGAVTSAILFPAHGSAVTSLLTISGTAASQPGIAEVGVSVQRASDGRYWNGASYAPEPTFVLASGTTNWVLNSPFAIHSGTGVFFITSRATDSAGALQKNFTLGVARVEVTRRLNEVANLAVTARSSATLEIAWSHNGNPPGTQYRVHFATGTCGSQNSGGATLFLASGETAGVIQNLLSDTDYQGHVHPADPDGGQSSGEGLLQVSARTAPAGTGREVNPAFTACSGGGGGGGGGGSGAGLALGADGAGKLWEVIRENGQVKLARFDANGVREGDLPLLGAAEQGDWSLAFDAGHVYAAGAAFSETSAVDLAVFKADLSGTLISSAAFNSPFSKNDFAFDAAGGVWIAGTMQTSGPADFSGPVAFELALWHFNPQNGLLSLATTYSAGAGFDAGLGVDLDAQGNVWTVGFSSNPATPGPAKLDLALWKFDPTGTALLGGPFRRPGYLKDPEGAFNAKLLLQSSGIFVAAARLGPAGDRDMAAVLFDFTGGVVSERVWRGAGSVDDFPRRLAAGPAGEILVAGGVGPESARSLALWSYNAGGGLLSAQGISTQGTANGVARLGGDIWLAPENQASPLRFQGGAALAGTEIVLTQGGDTTAPQLSLEPPDGSTVSTTRPLLAASYSDAESGIDATSVRLFLDEVDVTTQAVITASSASFSPSQDLGQGLHEFSASVADLAGNTASRSSRFTVALTTITLNPPVNLAVFARSSTTLELSWEPNGNPPGTRYTLDYATGAPVCSTELFHASSLITTSTSAILGGLSPATTYQLHVHGFPEIGQTTQASNIVSIMTLAFGLGSRNASSADYEFCVPPSTAPPAAFGAGRALSADASGNLWEVFDYSGSSVALAKFTPEGSFLSSATLPGAQGQGRWSIRFTAAGEALAVGGVAGQGGDPLDLAVYRVSADGGRVLSSAILDAGLGLADLAFDSAGEAWITGTIQTGGTFDAPDFKSKLALWRFSPQTGLLSLTTTYAGPGNLNGGLGVALDPEGHVWIAGLIENPAPGAVLEKLDLALWKFSADGTVLEAGPFLRPAFLRQADNRAEVRITYAADALFVTANKFNAAGNTDLHLLKFGRDGGLRLEKRWSGAAGLDEVGRDLGVDAGGNLVIAGEADGGQKTAAWTYRTDGTLIAARSDPGVFAPRGLALGGAKTWLAVDQSTAPYLFRGVDELQGSDTAVVFDTVPPDLALTPTGGSTVTVARPAVAAVYSDSGSGVDRASVRLFLDGTEITAQAVVTASSASFSPGQDLAQGTHLASATVADFAGNRSSASADFIIDSVAPQTLLVVGAPRFGAAPIKITTQTPLGFAVSEAGRTFFAVDAGSFTLFTGAITLSTEGLRTVRFFSEDAAGNRETTRTETLGVDASAPDTQLRLTGTAYSGGPLFIASSTLVGFTAQDPIVDSVAAGVARTEFRLDASTSFTVFDAGFTLPEGAHALVYRSVDNLGLFETDRSTWVFADATAPATSLLVNGQAAGDASLVAISTDVFSLTSTDTASGVAAIRYHLDGGTEIVFSAGFSLSPGSHTLAYFAVDNVGNIESSRTAAVSVSAPDTAAPSLALSPVHGSTVTAARPLIVAAYSDPAGIDLGSFRMILDGTDITALAVVGASSASFQPSTDLSQGLHTAVAGIADLAGHVATATSTFFIDSIAPQTTVLIGEPRFGAEPVFVASRTLLGFSATEPGQTFYAVDSMSFTPFTSSFSLTTEGLRAIAYFSKDTAGNQEVVRTTHVFTDNTAPVTAFLVNGIPATGTQLTATTTDFFSLTSTDSASGLARILFSLDASPGTLFAGAFNLSPGTHTVSFHAEDNVLNLEATGIVTVTVAGPDAQAPALSLAPANASTVTTPTPAILAFYSDEGSGIDPGSVRLVLDGVDITSGAAVSASSAVFTPATALTQGTHLVQAEAADRAGNRTSARAEWFLDSLPPVTTLLLNGQAATSPTIASSTDSFSFSATDTGTGVATILYALDGGAEQVFTAPFNLTAGNHTLSFHSRDRAGNLEAVQTAVVAVPAGGAAVTLGLKPETLNLAAFGQFLSAHIEVTGGATAAQIATNTVRVSHVDGRLISPPVFIDPKGPVSLSDEDGDGVAELKVKFPREQISAVLPGNAQPKVTVSGAFTGGQTFQAEDTIRTLGKGLTTAVDPDETGLALIAAYAFPNPAKGVNPTIRLQTRGTADMVTITIYNVFREVVHTASPGAPQRVDGRWTYDYPWDVSGRRTGVYTFRINARKAGFPELNAVGRVAVIR